MKVQISIDDKLLERVDRYAEENYMSRSGLISFACSQFLSAKEVSLLIRDMSLAMRKIAENGEIDDESKAKLQEFEILCKMLSTTNN